MGIVVVNGTAINNSKTTTGNVPIPPPTNTNVITSGLQLYYDASNASSYPGSGNIVYDLSGNNRTGSLQGTTGGYSSTAGGTWTFNGTNQFITTSFQPSSIFTLQMAFDNTYSYSADWNRGIFSTFGVNTNGIYIGTQLNMGNTSGMHMWIDNNAFYSIGTSSTFNINQWYIMTVVSTGSQVKIYLNGNTTPITTVNGGTTHSGTLAIGESKYDSNYWKGYIGNTLVYNRALSVSEITSNYDSLKGRFGLS